MANILSRLKNLVASTDGTTLSLSPQQEKPKTLNFFTDSELMCKCGNCKGLPKQELINKLNEIRAAYGKSITIASAFRCAEHNKKIGGAPKSAHIEGIAADLHRTPELLKFILDNAQKFNIWIEDPAATPTWIHIDLRVRDVGPTHVFKV